MGAQKTQSQQANLHETVATLSTPFPQFHVVDPVEACRERCQTGSRSLDCQFSVNPVVETGLPCPEA